MTKENYFSRKMVTKSDSELRYYVDNKSQFQEDAVLAAIWELDKRDKAEEDDIDLISQIELNKTQEKDRIANVKKESNITNDPNAPQLYNKKFILMYSALFSVFAGGILMAMNFTKFGNRKLGWLVIFLTLTYTIIQMIILGNIETNTMALTVPINYLGMYLFDVLIWKKYTPIDLKYRKRSIWGPNIIAIMVSIPLIYLII